MVWGDRAGRFFFFIDAREAVGESRSGAHFKPAPYQVVWWSARGAGAVTPVSPTGYAPGVATSLTASRICSNDARLSM